MRPDVRRDLGGSAADFARVVWPVLRAQCQEFQHSELGLIEGKHSPLHRDLDMHAGFDAYVRVALSRRFPGLVALRGIASRVQWGTDYQSFTIRIARPNHAPTEYEKRRAVLTRPWQGFLLPYWTVQAYLDTRGGSLCSVGVAHTRELYQYIDACEQAGPRLPRYPARNGGEEFVVVEWAPYQRAGRYCFTSPPLAQAASSPPEAEVKRSQTYLQLELFAQEPLPPEKTKRRREENDEASR